MSLHLVVHEPFGNYKRGDMIMDPALVASIEKGPHAHSVVKVISKPEHLSGDFFRDGTPVKAKR